MSPKLGYRLAPGSPGFSLVMLYHHHMAVLSPWGAGYIEPKWCLSMSWNDISIIDRNYIWCVSLPERQHPGDHREEIQVWIQVPGRGSQEIVLDFDEAEGMKPSRDSVARAPELAWGQMENHMRTLNKNLKPLGANSFPESVILWISWPGTF